MPDLPLATRSFRRLRALRARRAAPLFAALLACGLAWGADARAAVPPLPEAARQETSTLIVVGRVTQVFAARHARDRGLVDQAYCMEVHVEAVEKGDPSARGRVVYMRTWQPAERPDGWTGHQGQNRVPALGAVVRAYARAGSDGGLDLLLPNGVEPVEPTKLRGKVVRKPWTKTLESYRAGGSEYCVLEVDGRVEILQPSSTVPLEALCALDGKEVEVEGVASAGRAVPAAADDQHQRPVTTPPEGAGEAHSGSGERVGQGFVVLAVTPK